MPGFSDYLENKIIDHFLRGQASTAPAAVYVAVHTADPTDAGTGNAGTARVACTFAAPTNGVTSNTATVTFNGVAAGTYTYGSVWDAATGGNMLYSGALSASKTADAGDNLSFAAGQLTITNA